MYLAYTSLTPLSPHHCPFEHELAQATRTAVVSEHELELSGSDANTFDASWPESRLTPLLQHLLPNRSAVNTTLVWGLGGNTLL